MSTTITFELMLLIPSAVIGLLVWMAAGGAQSGRQKSQVLRRY